MPENADRGWRISEAKYWIGEGERLSKEGKNTVICGFVKTGDLGYKLSEVGLVLLHADPEITRERLIKRYSKNGVFDEEQEVIGKPISKFIAGNIWLIEKLKSEFEGLDFPIVDTSSLTPEMVAKKVAEVVLKR